MSRALFGLVICALAGCKAFDPCPDTKKQEKVGQLDGLWDVERISAAIVPSTSLPFPPSLLGGGTAFPQLLTGDLRFLTTESEQGSSCTELLKTRGIVTANYQFKEVGKKTVTDWQGGRFEYDHKSGVLLLKAYGETLKGTVTKTGEFDYEMRTSFNPGQFKEEYKQFGTLFFRFTKSPF